jgi:CBS domain-containing protein
MGPSGANMGTARTEYTPPIEGRGKSLIKDIMTTRRLVTVTAEDGLDIARRLMVWAGVKHLPVVKGRRVVGVVSERDLLRQNGGAADGTTKKVGGFMSSPAEVIHPEARVEEASATLLARRIGCLPVVDERGNLVGLVTRTNILGHHLRLAAAREEPRALQATLGRRVVTVHANQPVMEAVGLMLDHDIRHLPVVDGERKLVGIVSDRDIRSALGPPEEALSSERAGFELLQVRDVMSDHAVTVSDDDSLGAVAHRLADERVGAVPVVDREGHVVGIVSYVDLLRDFPSRQ